MDFFGHDVGRASSDFLFSIMWMAGLLFLFFHAVQVIAWDEENGAIYALLSRPISRAEYVLGVFAGLALLLFCLHLLLGTVAYGTLLLIKQSLRETYFPVFSMPHFVLTWLGIVVMQWVLLAAIMLFSGMVRGGFPVLLLTMAYYGICSGLPVVRASVSQHLSPEQSSSGLTYFLQALTTVFPDFSRLDFKDSVLSSQLLFSNWHIAVYFGVAGLYIALAIVFACQLYARRDLQ
ncbi:MAG TPA: hypothetical protein VKA31_06125 [Mariprofundaceae bacterium]|nr:hypothetical protein [Mariprofundaceae bacterium]